MKKTITLLTMVFLLSALLISCVGKNKEEDYYGTWDATSAIIKGSIVTIEELETTGDYTLSDFRIIIKAGGQAYIYSEGYDTFTDWELTEDGIKIGIRECYLEDNKLCIESDDIIICLEKTSNSQTISKPSKPTNKTDDSDEITNDNDSDEIIDDDLNKSEEKEELVYEYAYYLGTYSCKQYYLLDIDTDRFVRFSTVDTYIDEGEIVYHSLATEFELGVMCFLQYDGYDINDKTNNECFEPTVYGATISIWNGEEWVEWEAVRDFNVAEAERLLEEIKNN